MLTRKEIDAAMPKVAVGLAKYQRLRHLMRTDPRFAYERSFQKAFNGFYRVRRGTPWQRAFYATFAKCRRSPLTFSQVLVRLRRATGRTEASFASKLVATLDRTQPVIDSVVLTKLGLSLPTADARRRHSEINLLYVELGRRYRKFLKTTNGRYLVRTFRRRYGDGDVTQVKMLDFVMWQTRTARKPKRRAKFP